MAWVESFGLLMFVLFIYLAVGELQALSRCHVKLRELVRFDIAVLLTAVAAISIALAFRPHFGVLAGLAIGLGTAIGIKLLLTEVLAGTKYGADRSRVRKFRQWKPIDEIPVSATTESRRTSKRTKWWLIRWPNRYRPARPGVDYRAPVKLN